MQIEHLNQILEMGLRNGASDIHIKAGSPPAFRIDGKLQYLQMDALTSGDTDVVARALLRNSSVREQLDDLHEMDTSYSVAGVGRFRVNLYRQRGSLCAILRVIPSEVPNLEKLGLPQSLIALATIERGMVLVTGASGSGKSTTLAALVNYINHTRNAHIITIEDPIEYLHKNAMSSISQREIGADTSGYVVALRSALRQDPDVILVGEVRDSDAMDIALKAAETGHLVYSTVHTVDAVRTIGRLISLFPNEEDSTVRLRLADNLQGTISQRLLPRANGRGRVVACEIMRNTASVRQCIVEPERTVQLKSLIEKGGDQYGMQTFDQDLMRLYSKGIITLDTARAAASNASDLERALHYN